MSRVTVCCMSHYSLPAVCLGRIAALQPVCKFKASFHTRYTIRGATAGAASIMCSPDSRVAGVPGKQIGMRGAGARKGDMLASKLGWQGARGRQRKSNKIEKR